MGLHRIWRVYSLLVLVFITGCATQPKLYYWGSYEPLIYTMYSQPGAADPIRQIEALQTDIQKAGQKGLKVHPGLYAHLGYMYALAGQDEKALAAFTQEQLLFPESRKLIEHIQSKLVSPAKTQMKQQDKKAKQ